eukprot:9840120-Alexandrium_andersonii.AAC.1
MSASLVGSEMCIRDRSCSQSREYPTHVRKHDRPGRIPALTARPPLILGCLLYTSDAADDM